MLMRKTSAPARNSAAIIDALGRRRAERGDDLGPAQPSHQFLLRGAWIALVPRGRRRATAGQRHARLQRLLRRLVGRFGELHRPGRLLAGVDLEEAGAVIAARQAILGAADGEFLLARAHERAAGPFAAAVVVDRVDVVVARDQRPAQNRLAGARGQVPPAFGGPLLGVLVADRDADPAAGVVAEPEIGGREVGCNTTAPAISMPACAAGATMRRRPGPVVRASQRSVLGHYAPMSPGSIA